MNRWSKKDRKFIQNNEIDSFIEEVIEVSRKRGFSISHEDFQGGFEIEQFREKNADWLRHAADGTSYE